MPIALPRNLPFPKYNKDAENKYNEMKQNTVKALSILFDNMDDPNDIYRQNPISISLLSLSGGHASFVFPSHHTAADTGEKRFKNTLMNWDFREIVVASETRILTLAKMFREAPFQEGSHKGNENVLGISPELIEKNDETKAAFKLLESDKTITQVIFDQRKSGFIIDKKPNPKGPQSKPKELISKISYQGEEKTNYIIDNLFFMELNKIWYELLNDPYDDPAKNTFSPMNKRQKSVEPNNHRFLYENINHYLGNHFAHDPLFMLNAVNACLLVYEHIDIDYEKSLYPAWWLSPRNTVELSTSFITVEDKNYDEMMKAKIKKIKDIFTIWNYVSNQYGVSMMLNSKLHYDMYAFKEQIEDYADKIKMKEFIELYESGVPAQDIVA